MKFLCRRDPYLLGKISIVTVQPPPYGLALDLQCGQLERGQGTRGAVLLASRSSQEVATRPGGRVDRRDERHGICFRWPQPLIASRSPADTQRLRVPWGQESRRQEHAALAGCEPGDNRIIGKSASQSDETRQRFLDRSLEVGGLA